MYLISGTLLLISSFHFIILSLIYSSPFTQELRSIIYLISAVAFLLGSYFYYLAYKDTQKK